jgi:hypothetical protein
MLSRVDPIISGSRRTLFGDILWLATIASCLRSSWGWWAEQPVSHRFSEKREAGIGPLPGVDDWRPNARREVALIVWACAPATLSSRHVWLRRPAQWSEITTRALSCRLLVRGKERLVHREQN